MKARLWMLVLALVLAAALCGCRAAQSGAVPEYVLTYAENQPEDYPTTQGALEFARLVQQHTSGRVVVQVKYGGEFGTEQEVLDQMQFGGIDFARVSLSSVSDELPVLNLLQLPFLYRDAEHLWKVLDGEMGEELLGCFSQVELIGLSWYDAGARSFYSDRPIRGPEDLAGLTIRVQPSRMMEDMVALLGAQPLALDYREVYEAFETGRIDAAENNWPAYQKQRHYELAPYYLADEHTRVPEIQLASAQTWAALPQELRDIILQCAKESAAYERRLWSEEERQARETARANHCREIALSAEACEEFRQAVQPLYERYCAGEAEQALLARIQQE
ncbi:MAG: TRAP transporter substrate-binding protein [Faecalibacterium sp.]